MVSQRTYVHLTQEPSFVKDLGPFPLGNHHSIGNLGLFPLGNHSFHRNLGPFALGTMVLWKLRLLEEFGLICIG